MPKSSRYFRPVASVPIVAGGATSLDLPRGYDYESIFFRISAQVTVAAGGATSVRAEAPCQLVPRLQILADGKNMLDMVPFWAICLGRYERKLTQSGARAITPPTAAAAADYTVEAIGVVDFMTVNGLRTKDSNFRTSGLSLFQAQFQFGQPGDIFVPGAGAVTFKAGTSPVVEVFTQELVEQADPKTGKFTTPVALIKRSWQRAAIAATNPNFEIKLPAGNLIKSVLVRGEGSVTALEPSTGVVNNVTLKAGVDYRMNLSAAGLRAKNNADHGYVTPGYYIADVTSKGGHVINLTDLWDVTGQAEPKLIIDGTGGANNYIDAIIEEYLFASA